MIFPVNRSDPHTGYRLIYSATPTQDLILMLESEDATHWAPADLSGYPTREPGGGSSHNRTMINEVMRVQWSPGSPDGGGGMCGAFDDEGPDTPPAERFKMLIMDGKVLASPDAIVWSGAPPTPFRLRNVEPGECQPLGQKPTAVFAELPNVTWQGSALDTAGEPPGFVFYEPIEQRYVFTSRAHPGDRRVYLHSMQDDDAFSISPRLPSR